MEHKRAVGEAILRVRLQKGLAQEGVGASQTYISDVERGLKSPSLEKISKISAALDVHPTSIVVLSYLLENPRTSLDELLKKVRCEVEAALGANQLL
ncbi:helix-turn-helix domain-containing protein [Pseudomonas turukhanskensis]|uniref:Transcriptional regulator n=1 Tax=Pseudomonas turukhanskensis TaxID=1806536 RepID=A0A9W6NHD0_9PSED|nr:helix-turn-helix transcriptional regulator [Pseudomonas turukhanskensis]GLK90762.1 transcriptional regulator [Pseudomonas turukhanskensis]